MQIIEILRPALALVAGALIGNAFGRLQALARRRHEIAETEGRLRHGWSLMPGAGARVAYFLIALIVIQLICPLLFADGTQWWVSAGVGLGYGFLLMSELRQRLAAVRGPALATSGLAQADGRKHR